MSYDALFASHADLLRDPERYGKEGVYLDPSTTPATRVTVTGIHEILGVDPLLQAQEGDSVMEQGTYDLPTTLTISMQGAFEIDGQIWKITGLGGRDSHSQTITIQRPIVLSKRTAKRRG